MPDRTTTRPRRKTTDTSQKEQATTATAKPVVLPERRLGGRLVGMGLGLLVLLVLQSSMLIGSLPLVGLATMFSGLFMVSLVASGAQIWRGVAPQGRLVSLMSGSGALWLAILGGLMIGSAGLVPEWQSGYAQDYATSTLPVILGGVFALMLGGWVSSTLHSISRLRRGLMLYSGLAVVTSVAMFSMFPTGLTAETVGAWRWLQRLSGLLPISDVAFTSPWIALGLLLSCGAHLLIFWGAWRLRADTEALNQRSLEDLW
ncbi:MAG: hypothetical protein ACI8S6_003096 [Myxococcota bacterium]|jgi:hypothetical protein